MLNVGSNTKYTFKVKTQFDSTYFSQPRNLPSRN